MIRFFCILFFILMAQLPSYSSEIELKRENAGTYVFIIPLSQYKEKIKPYVTDELKTVNDVFSSNNFELVVNGGYFDPATGEPVSSVVIDSVEVNNIWANPKLVESLKKSERFDAVLNRTEFRIIESKKGLKFDIQEHNAPLKKGQYIKHSIQAGPMLIPDLRLIEESFVKEDGKGGLIQLACDTLKRRERTIIGLKESAFTDGYLYIIIFTKENKVALNEARDYCLKLGLDKAMAMDGGASTSINWKDIEIFGANDTLRRVKSFLVIEN